MSASCGGLKVSARCRAVMCGLAAGALALGVCGSAVGQQGGGQPGRGAQGQQQGDRGDRGDRGEGRGGFRGGDFQGRMGGFGGMGGMGGGFGGDMMTAPLSSRDLTEMVELFGMTTEQKKLAESLFEGFQQEFRAHATELRDSLEAAREQMRGGGGREGGGFEAMRDRFTGFMRQREAMERAFLDDLRTVVLTEEQATKWPKFERTRRRSQQMGRGLMSGERVDVIRLVDEAKVTPEVAAELAPVLDRYELELDRALVKRSEVFQSAMSRMGDLQREGAMDQAQKLLQEGRDASTQVREINKRFARQVASLLPEGSRAEFEQAVRLASFPDVYRESLVSRQLSAASAFTTLDEGQRAALASLADSYQRQVSSLNDRIASARERWESEVTIEQLFARGGRDRPDEELRDQKRELDRTTGESLRRLLTPEQAEKLPQPEEDGRRGRGGAGAAQPPQIRF